jgi:peptide-methionine (S)-S-oxide reductase
MFGQFLRKPATLPEATEALPGRADAMAVPTHHHVNGHPMTPPYAAGLEILDVGLGCFWGAERKFWKIPGVWVTAVGYQGGHTPNPTYEEVCSGRTGHTEAVRVVYDPAKIALTDLLRAFWEAHDPTQGMRQGNDVGTQYRSALYPHNAAQMETVIASRDAYQARLSAAGYGPITTEIRAAPTFYFAEAYHQQYLAKNPNGYCGLGGTGVTCAL